jgi:hypothetical protein
MKKRWGGKDGELIVRVEGQHFEDRRQAVEDKAM